VDRARFQRLRGVYERANGLPPGERTPFLDAACDGDPDLLREARRMLAADDAPLFLASLDGDGPRSPVSSAPVPSSVGPYEIQAVLGEGGFGVVYRAEQREPVERTVALKVLHRRRDDERSILRFEAEVQTLARLRHPCIAQIFDAGRSSEGLRYFAMELVDGRPVTVWCDEHRLGIDERLSLFARICAAVQHAHQRGVVHRDLKPSNVLVEERDGEPAPKVIDFGIAKLTDPSADRRGPVTREGLPLGTPGYMSPEQASGEAVDTRTDVYALGVLLYDLLSGDLPFARERLATGNAAEVLRILREEEPRRMSTAALEGTEPVDALARSRACSRAALLATLSGDLQWVVRRALEKDPEARYESVSALLADLERYRRDEPVDAREPAALYVLRKFVARNRLGVGIAVASTLLIVVGITGLVWALREVSDARDLAVERGTEADSQRARAVLNEYAAHLAAARSALQIGDAQGARRHLADAALEHRGWEWRHLAGRLDASLAAFDTGDRLVSVHWLDDERVLAFQAQAAWILDVASDRVERRIDDLSPQFDDCVIDRANRRIVLDLRLRIEVRDLDTWERTRVLFEPVEDVRAMELAPDGRTLFVADNAGVVRAIDVDGERPVRELCRLDTYCWDLRVGAGGDVLALGLDSGAIELRDALTGLRVQPPLNAHREAVKALLLSRDGSRVYAAAGGTVQVWDLAERSLLARTDAGVELRELALSPDESLLYGGGGYIDNRLTCWDARTLELRSRFHGHRRGVNGVAVRADGARLASASGDGTVRVWPAEAAPPFVALDAGFDARDLSVAADGSSFATADMRGVVRVWGARELDEELRVETERPLRGCALGRDEVFVSGEEMLAIDRRTGAIRRGDAPPAAVARLTMDADERWLVATETTGERVYVWRLPELALVHALELRSSGRTDFDPSRGEFVLGGLDVGLHRLDPEAGTAVYEADPAARIWAVATGENRLALALEDRVVLRSLDGTGPAWSHAAPTAIAAAFTPGGDRLALGGGDTVLRIWDLNGAEVLVLDDAPKPLGETAFADGERRLLGLSHLPGSPCYVVVWSAPASVSVER